MFLISAPDLFLLPSVVSMTLFFKDQPLAKWESLKIKAEGIAQRVFAAMHPTFSSLNQLSLGTLKRKMAWHSSLDLCPSLFLPFFFVPFPCLLLTFFLGNLSTDQILSVLFWLEGCCLPWWRRYEILPTRTAILLLRFFSLLPALRYGSLQCERDISPKGSSSVLPQCAYLFVCHPS